MIYFKTLRDWPDELFIHGSMRSYHPTPERQLSMSVLIDGATSPDPTWSREATVFLLPTIGSDFVSPSGSSPVVSPVAFALPDYRPSSEIRLMGDRSLAATSAKTTARRIGRRKILSAASVIPVAPKIGTWITSALATARAWIDTSILSASTLAQYGVRLAVLGGDI